MASKTENMCQRHTFLGEGGSGVRDMAPPLLGNLGASSLKHHSLILQPIFKP